MWLVQDGAIGKLKRRQFFRTGLSQQLGARPTQEREWTAMAGDYLFIRDVRTAKRFLNFSARMEWRPSVVTVTYKQFRHRRLRHNVNLPLR